MAPSANEAAWKPETGYRGLEGESPILHNKWPALRRAIFVEENRGFEPKALVRASEDEAHGCAEKSLRRAGATSQDEESREIGYSPQSLPLVPCLYTDSFTVPT